MSVKKLTNQNIVGKESDNNIFVYSAIRFPMLIAQCFGYFPVCGLNGKGPEALRFTWFSLRMLYSLTLFSTVTFMTVTVIRKIIFVNGNLHEINNLMFHICGGLYCILLIKLAKDWPTLMKSWHQIENQMKSYGIQTNLRLQLRFMTLIFLTVASLEHFLVLGNRFYGTFQCTRTISDGFRHFFVNASLSHIFVIIEYSLWKGIFFQTTLFIMTFAWTFLDVFIILISLALTMRIKQLTYKIRAIVRSKIDNIEVWRNIREEHFALNELCTLIDKKISFIVLLSYYVNLYFTLIQFFFSLRPMKVELEKAYFFVSFSFLIGRLVCVCLFGASVSDENNELIAALLAVSSSCYNFEVKRFLDQVNQVRFVISGRRFFKITRGLILNIAGAIVTYELVLVQFNAYLLNEIEVEQPLVVNLSKPDYWLC